MGVVSKRWSILVGDGDVFFWVYAVDVSGLEMDFIKGEFGRVGHGKA